MNVINIEIWTYSPSGIQILKKLEHWEMLFVALFSKHIQPFVSMVYCCAIADQLALYSICGWAMCM